MARSTVATPPAKGRARGRRKTPPPPPPPKRSPWRHWKWWLAALLLIGLGLGARLFLAPATDTVTTTGGVVVFDGKASGQLAAALGLMNRQAAAVLVLPGGTDPAWPEANRLCAGSAPFTVVCPEGGSDRGVAQLAGKLAEERGWTSVAIVAPQSQLSRAALLTKRCTGATVLRVAVGSDQGGLARVGSAVAEGFRYLGAVVSARSC